MRGEGGAAVEGEAEQRRAAMRVQAVEIVERAVHLLEDVGIFGVVELLDGDIPGHDDVGEAAHQRLGAGDLALAVRSHGLEADRRAEALEIRAAEARAPLLGEAGKRVVA